MKPHYLLIAAITSLTACTYSGFNPPLPMDYWQLRNDPTKTYEEFREREKKDM